MSLTYNNQLHLLGIINHLVYEPGDTYDVSKGRDLRDLVLESRLRPVPAVRTFKSETSSGGYFSAYAAGVGSVSVPDKKEKISESGVGERIFTGNWAVFIAPMPLFSQIFPIPRLNRLTAIGIEHRFNMTREIEDAEVYILVLDEKREPAEFRKMKLEIFTTTRTWEEKNKTVTQTKTKATGTFVPIKWPTADCV